MTFTKLHFTLIAGLKCHGRNIVRESKLGDALRNKYFLNKMQTKTTKKETLEFIFQIMKLDNTLDVVKVALVYLVAHALLSNVKNAIWQMTWMYSMHTPGDL